MFVKSAVRLVEYNLENSGSDFSCIAIVSRCVYTGLKLIEDAIYQVYKKSSLKYSF